jgi:hypothetical protein
LGDALKVALDPATGVCWFELDLLDKELMWTALRTALDRDIPAAGYLFTERGGFASATEVFIIGYSESSLAKGGTIRTLYVRNPYDASGYDIFSWERIEGLAFYQPLKHLLVGLHVVGTPIASLDSPTTSDSYLSRAVPDFGSTLPLLGLAVSGLVALRGRFRLEQYPR